MRGWFDKFMFIVVLGNLPKQILGRLFSQKHSRSTCQGSLFICITNYGYYHQWFLSLFILCYVALVTIPTVQELVVVQICALV